MILGIKNKPFQKDWTKEQLKVIVKVGRNRIAEAQTIYYGACLWCITPSLNEDVCKKCMYYTTKDNSFPNWDHESNFLESNSTEIKKIRRIFNSKDFRKEYPEYFI